MYRRCLPLIGFGLVAAAGAVFLTSASASRGGAAPAAARPQSDLVRSGNSSGAAARLVYKPYSDRGDILPDFSRCGYAGGGVALPAEVPVRETLSAQPGNGDDLARIQAAIDHLAAQTPDPKTGFRGALLLKKGVYRLSDSLHIQASGIVLRGEGAGENGTILHGTGRKAYPLILVKGASRWTETPGSRREIADSYVPSGARTFRVAAGAAALKPGDTVMVIRHGNAAWIHEIAMDRIQERPGHPGSTKQWQPFDLSFDRIVTAVEGDKITVDAPIVCAIDSHWGGGAVARYTDTDRIEKVGIENLYGTCDFDRTVTEKEKNKTYLADENHAKQIVTFDNVKNAWARDLAARYLENCVGINGGAKWVTVQDCSSIDPISILTGGRRYSFNVNGQLCLVQRCYARDPRHAFVVGSRVCGPNVFLDCKAEQEHATSEPHHRWSVGGLFDNVTASIAFQDRQWMGSGHGWAGANYIAWNCTGSLVAQQPPTAQNFAIGQVGKKDKGAFDRPDGHWESFGTHVEPRSLYLTQLQDRLGPRAVAAVTIPAQRAETPGAVVATGSH